MTSSADRIQMRYFNDTRQILILSALACICFLNATSCSLRQRENTDAALHTVKRLRQAQASFRKDNGKFGTLNDLIERGLMESDISNGIRYGYIFEVRIDEAGYSVTANPLPDSSGELIGNHFFMDQTGVIRASNRHDAAADKFSEPIKNQRE